MSFVLAVLGIGIVTLQSSAQSIYTSYAFTNFAGLPGVGGTNDGTGSAARFGAPSAIAVDKAGNLFVADTSSQTIRKITPAGVVTTMAGSPGQRGSTDGT